MIERGKVREFARAIDADLPEYISDPDPIIPPTFLTVAASWAPHELELLDACGVDTKRALHGEQEYVFHGQPPRAGSTLRGVTRVESIEVRDGRRGGKLKVIVLVTDYANEAGTVVAFGRTTVIETERAPTLE